METSPELRDSASVDTRYTQNRELSWLRFNRRVLCEAETPTTPLLERLRFLSIVCSNLDEFFMIRVGTLHDMAGAQEPIIDNKSGMTPQQQLKAIMQTCVDLYVDMDHTYVMLMNELYSADVVELEVDDLTAAEQSEVRKLFRNLIFPVLSPQIIDWSHPFPHLTNLATHTVFRLRRIERDPYADNEAPRFWGQEPSVQTDSIGIISIPEILPTIISLTPDCRRFIRTEKLVLAYAAEIFLHYKIEESLVIRVTRNGDVSPDDDDYIEGDDDFRDLMKRILDKRKRLAAVRLEVDRTPSPYLGSFLTARLQLSTDRVFVTRSLMRPALADAIIDKVSVAMRAEHSFPPFTPQEATAVDADRSIMEQLRERDLILSYPYESMDPFIRLLREAVSDPDVLSIKITIYRLAAVSKVAEQLAAAAEQGKEVVVLLELRARFDEKNNIDWSSRLESAGCRVIYGMDGYKVHSKICLITRMSDGQIETFTQIGTGNYNEKTARQYTDFSFMTSRQDIGRDGVAFFNNMLIGNLEGQYERLLVAPLSLQEGLGRLIRREIERAERGETALIRLKLNSISDRRMLDLLQEASAAGVKVDLMVRGICCILPGIEGLTENIRIQSIVGRFLEHHRVYCFGAGEDSDIYISSADWMTRNIRRRVEIACPIDDPEIRKFLLEFMSVCFADNIKGRRMLPDGSLTEMTPEEVDREQLPPAAIAVAQGELPAQQWFMRTAIADAEAKAKELKAERADELDRRAAARLAHTRRRIGAVVPEDASATEDPIPAPSTVALKTETSFWRRFRKAFERWFGGAGE